MGVFCQRSSVSSAWLPSSKSCIKWNMTPHKRCENRSRSGLLRLEAERDWYRDHDGTTPSAVSECVWRYLHSDEFYIRRTGKNRTRTVQRAGWRSNKFDHPVATIRVARALHHLHAAGDVTGAGKEIAFEIACQRQRHLEDFLCDRGDDSAASARRWRYHRLAATLDPRFWRLDLPKVHVDKLPINVEWVRFHACCLGGAIDHDDRYDHPAVCHSRLRGRWHPLMSEAAVAEALVIIEDSEEELSAHGSHARRVEGHRSNIYAGQILAIVSQFGAAKSDVAYCMGTLISLEPVDLAGRRRADHG